MVRQRRTWNERFLVGTGVPCTWKPFWMFQVRGWHTIDPLQSKYMNGHIHSFPVGRLRNPGYSFPCSSPPFLRLPLQTVFRSTVLAPVWGPGFRAVFTERLGRYSDPRLPTTINLIGFTESTKDFLDGLGNLGVMFSLYLG